MMDGSNVQYLDRGRVHFGFDLDPVVDGHLQRAAAQVADRVIPDLLAGMEQ